MAQNFIFCSVLWIVVAIIAEHTAVAQGSTTVTPPTTLTTTTTLAPATSTAATDPCDKNPCGRGSMCEARADQTFICLCPPGDYYNSVNKRCESTKVFPGQLQLPQIVYENSMSDKISSVFKRTADNITEELFKSLGSDPTYRGCIVLELRPVNNIRLRVNQHVNASVELIYSPDSTVTTSQVQEMVKTATECINCSLAGATFTGGDLCQRNPCHEATRRCSSLDGSYSCPCLDGYVPSNHSVSDGICLACPSGTKAKDSKCVDCPFGHSGVNCNDTWQLTLVIVGSVLGGLLLISLIFLTIVSVRSLKKSSKKNQAADIGAPYISHFPAKGPVVNSSSVHSQVASGNRSASGLAAANAGFPLASANKSPDNRNSQLDDNQYDEIKPYAIYEPTHNNPYARSQGRTNPYYS